MKKPQFQRQNLKARKVHEPPSGVDPAEIAKNCRHVGSPYHKDVPSSDGTPPVHRPDASICPRHLANHHQLVEGWLRDAVKAGHTGAWHRGYPRRVWYRDGETVYEALQTLPGKYHGYPLEPEQTVRGLP